MHGYHVYKNVWTSVSEVLRSSYTENQRNVTVFWKTDRMDTNTEIHFLSVYGSHTHALFRDTKHLRLDGGSAFTGGFFPTL